VAAHEAGVMHQSDDQAVNVENQLFGIRIARSTTKAPVASINRRMRLESSPSFLLAIYQYSKTLALAWKN
jgi:hypothetical protein